MTERAAQFTDEWGGTGGAENEARGLGLACERL